MQPSLKTIRMVEDTIKKAQSYPSRRQLWLSLPKKMQYQRFMEILKYLKESNKIIICKDGEIVWIYDPKFIKHMKGRMVEV